jgi:menaquinone-dependent protoporphyrinogen oxidase
MTVLVGYATKHGSTREVAERVADKLRQTGHAVDLQTITTDSDVSAYEAVVLGSAIYYGSWLKEATDFVRANGAALAKRPTWLFSVGPLGVEVKDTQEQPKELAEFRESIRFRDHHLFFGALHPDKLSFAERIVIKAVRAPEGDYRNWEEVDAWAGGIAAALTHIQPQPGETQPELG